MSDDLYATLGVAEDASAEQIKSAYRALARKHHPDANPGDARAEERFKEISHANDVLSDPDTRAEYDAMRRGPVFEDFAGGGYGSGAFGGVGGFDLNDLFGSMFTQARGPAPAMRGQDLSVDVTIDWMDGFRGTQVPITVTGADGTRVTHSVKIPPGAKDGTRVRLKGKGGQGAHGGPAGDLEVGVTLRPHRHFGRSGNDVTVDVPISIDEAALGAKVDVPTPTGGRVKVTVPAGSPHGKTLRVAGKGAPKLRGDGAGDLLVRLSVVIPTDLTDAQRDALAAYATLQTTDVRKDLTP